jgi:hypothetical protein
MKKLSLILINVAVLCTLLVLVNVGAFVTSLLLPKGEAASAAGEAKDSPQTRYPNMAALAWAPTHFGELDRLAMRYHSFVGWRRKPFQGETITIDERGIRQSTDDPGSDAPVVGMFGGSTLWGTGVRDDGTIASSMNRQGGGAYRAVNYGETGYRAIQGYLTLVGEYQAGSKFSHVVFYDGVNDVYTGCRADIPPYAHYFDRQYAEIIDYFGETAKAFEAGRDDAGASPDVTPSASTLVQPVVDLLNRLYGRPAPSILGADRISSILNNTATFECDRDPARAEAAARMLVTSWTDAAALAKREGAEFTAFLQPVAYFTTSDVSYLGLEGDFNAQARLKAQYEAVYPRIRELAREAASKHGFRFVDLSAALDQPDAAYYIDFCHVSPNGNEVLARAIAQAAMGGA